MPSTGPRQSKGQTRQGSRWRSSGFIASVLIGVAIVAVAVAAFSTTPHSNQTSPPASPAPSSATDGSVAFAQCIRQHGVPDFPDPQGGHFLISNTVQGNPNFQSAVQACQNLLPNGATNNSGSNSSQLLAFARCMQTHGVPQFPDPAANGAIVAPQGIDPNSPQFQQAWQECQSNLPANLQGQQP